MKTTGFHFGIPIEICGKTYYMDLNRDGVSERFAAMHDKIMSEVDKAKETGDPSVIIGLTREFIDLILGAGSYDTIFAGRVQSSYDIHALYEYITGVAKEKTKELKKTQKNT